MIKMKAKGREESRHYAQIWEKVIRPVFKVVSDECDKDFREKCGLTDKFPEGWKKQLEIEYRSLRKELKNLCYGNHDDSGLLDGRKIAAIFCKALIRKKAFKFDLDQAFALMQEKKKQLSPVRFNLWAAQTVYINYKLAYYASLQLVYLTLLHDLQASEDTKPLALVLNQKGHLYSYPAPSGADSFDVNIIIGLARADLSGRDMDMFLFGMQLYQIEMYSVETLKKEVAGKVAQQIAKDATSISPDVVPPKPSLPSSVDKTVTYGKTQPDFLYQQFFPIFTAESVASIASLWENYYLDIVGKNCMFFTSKLKQPEVQGPPSFCVVIYPTDSGKTFQEVEYPKAIPSKRKTK